MLILAVDTSHKDGTVSLARGSGSHCTVLETATVDGGTFSSQLVPKIAELLRRHKFTKNDIDLIAAATGPGSFTGLRIGLAAVKGLAEALNKPIVSVSVLAAIAAAAQTIGHQPILIVAVMDAGRSELYVGEYKPGETGLDAAAEYLCSRDELTSRLAQIKAVHVVIATEPSFAETLASSGVSVNVVAQPASAAIARLGYTKFLAGKGITVDELEANYVRGDENLFTRQ